MPPNDGVAEEEISGFFSEEKSDEKPQPSQARSRAEDEDTPSPDQEGDGDDKSPEDDPEGLHQGADNGEGEDKEAPHNKYCHFCQHVKLRASAMLACQNKGCARRFCEHCLTTQLSDDVNQTSSDAWIEGLWHCPVCRKFCCCAQNNCTANHRHCKAYRYRKRRAELAAKKGLAAGMYKGPGMGTQLSDPSLHSTFGMGGYPHRMGYSEGMMDSSLQGMMRNRNAMLYGPSGPWGPAPHPLAPSAPMPPPSSYGMMGRMVEGLNDQSFLNPMPRDPYLGHYYPGARPGGMRGYPEEMRAEVPGGYPAYKTGVPGAEGLSRAEYGMRPKGQHPRFMAEGADRLAMRGEEMGMRVVRDDLMLKGLRARGAEGSDYVQRQGLSPRGLGPRHMMQGVQHPQQAEGAARLREAQNRAELRTQPEVMGSRPPQMMGKARAEGLRAEGPRNQYTSALGPPPPKARGEEREAVFERQESDSALNGMMQKLGGPDLGPRGIRSMAETHGLRQMVRANGQTGDQGDRRSYNAHALAVQRQSIEEQRERVLGNSDIKLGSSPTAKAVLPNGSPEMHQGMKRMSRTDSHEQLQMAGLGRMNQSNLMYAKGRRWGGSTENLRRMTSGMSPSTSYENLQGTAAQGHKTLAEAMHNGVTMHRSGSSDHLLGEASSIPEDSGVFAEARLDLPNSLSDSTHGMMKSDSTGSFGAMMELGGLLRNNSEDNLFESSLEAHDENLSALGTAHARNWEW